MRKIYSKMGLYVEEAMGREGLIFPPWTQFSS